jgi:SOS response regulatory protein OraA/RecX
MVITSIKQQLKNPERASIFIDKKYAFSLSLSELVQERLKLGQQLEEPDVKRLRKLSDDGKLRARALEWVLNRPRSVREFQNYLYRKKAEPEISTQLTEEFKARDYLSDTKFADWLIELRRRGGKSDRAIRSELMSKGVSREEIDSSLTPDSAYELARLKELADKKKRLPRYKSEPLKLKQYLLRQGFSYDDINTVLKD